MTLWYCDDPFTDGLHLVKSAVVALITRRFFAAVALATPTRAMDEVSLYYYELSCWIKSFAVFTMSASE